MTLSALFSSPRARAIEPIDRISEILFGLIMVLTFTGSLSVAEAGRDDVRAMLVGALGCNFAWGVIDAILYLMGCAAERRQALAMFRRVRDAASQDDGRRAVAEALPPMVAGLLKPEELDAVRQRLALVPEPPAAGHLHASDFRGAVSVFLLVFLSTFPVAIPFILMDNVQPAMRVSNIIAVVLLFLTGFAYGRLTERPPLLVGSAMVVLGLVLVGLTMALGG